jgi:hypothetical protein
VIVDHPHGGHDDHATAVALAVVACRQTGTSTLTAREILAIGDERDSDEDRDAALSRMRPILVNRQRLF